MQSRQGLMTEAVAAVNDFWFDVLAFRVLRAPKAVGNIASRRISDRACISVRLSSFPIGFQPRWEITAEEWRNCKRNIAARRAPGEQTG